MSPRKESGILQERTLFVINFADSGLVGGDGNKSELIGSQKNDLYSLIGVGTVHASLPDHPDPRGCDALKDVPEGKEIANKPTI